MSRYCAVGCLSGSRQVTGKSYGEQAMRDDVTNPVFELPGGWGLTPQLFA
jgi:hypothetical protein